MVQLVSIHLQVRGTCDVDVGGTMSLIVDLLVQRMLLPQQFTKT